MNWEVEDYRKRPPIENIGQWPVHYVPKRMVRGYVYKFIIFFYLIPMYFFGGWFGSLATFFLYFIVWDMLEYRIIKRRIRNGE